MLRKKRVEDPSGDTSVFSVTCFCGREAWHAPKAQQEVGSLLTSPYALLLSVLCEHLLLFITREKRLCVCVSVT